MRILMTGASGFIGRRLWDFLRGHGHEVVPLARTSSDPTHPCWNLDAASGSDAVVHLAGENIAQWRWTKKAKERIYQSRVRGTRWLSEALAKMPKRPAVLVCASGSAYYGNRADEILDEQSAPGTGFLAKVAQDWEAAAEPVRAAGIRVVHMRIGVVLHPEGGALAQLLPPFRLGAGGKFGSGKQYWSWIALPDMLAAIDFLLQRPDLSGPVNMVGPNPVTNKQFTKTLGAVLHRPAFFTNPRLLLRLALGEMADEALFTSFRVLPKRLQDAGFAFKYPDLKAALETLLNAKAKNASQPRMDTNAHE